MKHTYTERGVGVHFGYITFVFFYAISLPNEIATQIYCMYKESIILEAIQLSHTSPPKKKSRNLKNKHLIGFKKIYLGKKC